MMTTKKSNYVAFSFLFMLITCSTINAQTIKMVVDKPHANVSFSVSMAAGFTRVTGKFNEFDINFNYVNNSIAQSSVEAIIQVKSINTGIEGRDRHLVNDDFFDIEKYPLITFTSDSIRGADQSYIAYGTFTMHGILKKIQLPFKHLGKNKDGELGFSSRHKVSRRDFLLGKDTLKPEGDAYLSDEVMIELDFLVKQPKDK